MWTSSACVCVYVCVCGGEHICRTPLPTGLHVDTQEDLKIYIWGKFHSVLFLSETYRQSIILPEKTQPQVLKPLRKMCNYLPRREHLS